MRKLVFIVEDNPVQQRALQLHFEKHFTDYDVKCFDNPDTMMTVINQNPYAVILDHFFGDDVKTGLDYLRILRKDFKSVPIIYYTSLDDDDLKANVLAMGAEQYIIKNSASLIYLRTALDQLAEKGKKSSFFGRLFGKGN